MITEKVRGYLDRCGFAITSMLAYFPVLGGILGPMIMMAGVLSGLVYFVWNFLLIPLLIPLSVFSPDVPMSVHFLEGFIEIPELLIPIYQVLPYVLTGGGIFFFLYGVLELARAKKRQQEFTRSGVYRIIRHPQNLGLIVIGLGLTFFIYQTWQWETFVVRLGDIYSWLLFSFIWLIEAKWEEERLIAKLGTQYLNYQNKVPFLIPFGKKVEDPLLGYLNPNWSLRKRILLWLGIYIAFSLVSVFLILFFDLIYWTR
ncbi:MAG: methyltransferase family protein [Candidatus Hodarchaeales archaeon]